MAGWEQVMDGDFQAHVARVGRCHLSIIGGGDVWHWFVRCRRHGRAEDQENTLAAAQAAAENTACGLADEGSA
jgi:hypothetical protein